MFKVTEDEKRHTLAYMDVSASNILDNQFGISHNRLNTAAYQ